MAATFNWSIRPGITNKYGISIATSADDVAPSNAYYVAIWGNDTTGNGSRLKPYRTIAKTGTLSYTNRYIIVGNGIYRESGSPFLGTVNLVGDGNTIFDATTLNSSITPGGGRLSVYGISFKNYGISGNEVNFIDCKLVNCTFSSGSLGIGLNNCLIIDSVLNPQFTTQVTLSRFKNSTFIRCYVGYNNSLLIENQNNIHFYCNVDFVTSNAFQQQVDYSLFYRCNFRAVYGVGAAPSISTVFYPNTPTGYQLIENINSLRTYLLSVIISQSNVLSNCVIADPLFNNIGIGDYTLSFASPAKNLSYFGNYVGVYSIAKALSVKINPTASSFDNSTAINLTIADDSLTLIDINTPASIVTKPIDNTAGREISKLPTFGINADRNGEYVDATTDLDTVIINAGSVLSAGKPYLVEIGAITYNSQVYQVGDRFTSLVSSPGIFTTVVGGVVREILEAPARENVEARFSDGEIGYTASGNMVVGNWYYVELDTVTYEAVTYPVGSFIKCNAATSFSGSGSIRLIFANTDPYFFFEINQKPTSNNVDNIRTNPISKGNGDKDFDRATANVFPISRKFIQLKYTIQVNNLIP